MLVLATDYPKPDGYIQLMYIHVRNKYYIDNGIDVTVLNFRAQENYVIDNISVITLDYYNSSQEKYDLLISHASNLRNHYRFIKKYENNFPRIVFFFHGHEVLNLNAVYPEPYPYQNKTSKVKIIAQNTYDYLKLKLWRKYYSKLSYKSHFVFVSEWLYHQFLYWTKINEKLINDKYSIIHNSVGKVFEDHNYDTSSEKIYDVISIRSNIDGSTYCVDIINNLARNNPSLKFLLVGRGLFFEYNDKADNLIWIDKVISHEEMIKLLNNSKCGLLPTRHDTQGVMACEMMTFGIPVITSNISICKEILCDTDNVKFISNEKTDLNLKPIVDQMIDNAPYRKNQRYFAKNTTKKEIKLFKELCQSSLN